MRISRITLTHVRIPLGEPFRISNGEVAEKDGIVCAVDADGLTGYGESSPMAGSFYSTDTPESCWRQLIDELAPALLARSFTTLHEASEWIDQQPGSNFAKAGLETALWDIEAQRLGLPLHRLLGASRDHAESGLAVGLYDDTGQLLNTIAKYLPDGYKRVKIKICPGHDIALVEAVRARFGDIPLMTDANASYSLAGQAIYQKLDEFGLRMYEQPLKGDALEDSAILQTQIQTPICLDESLESFHDLERAAALQSFRIANIKIQRVGGFRNALKLYHRCRELGLSIWIGTMPELGIGQAQGAAMSALPACDYPTDVEASLRWFQDDIIHPFLEVRDGCIPLPQTPGLGYIVDEAKLQRYLVARQVIEQ
jgi:O-succinylbenzoate synthase